MATLQNTKRAIADIQNKLEPVLKKLKGRDVRDDSILPQAQASVALSIGMMRYMGARLRGLDQGRSKDDPLRQELNKMKKVLAEIKKRRGGVDTGGKHVENIPGDNNAKLTISSEVAATVESIIPVQPQTFLEKRSKKRKPMAEPTDSVNQTVNAKKATPKSKKQR
jgi:hypothetical protein